MRPSSTSWAAIAVALAAAGCAAGSGAGTAPGGTGPSMAADEYEELYLARLDSARMRFTEADVRFMTRMIHHHMQALEMAELVPRRTSNTELRTLAARIINAQTDEIAIMRRWLEDRRQPVPHLSGEPAGAPNIGHVHQHELDMPGMLTPEELRRLERARGREFDRHFLSGMIRHHQGAVTMVEELFATDGAGQDEAVFKFASDVQVDQGNEVARMQIMLEALPPAGGPQ